MLIIFIWASLLYIKTTYEYPLRQLVAPHEFIPEIMSNAGLCTFPFGDPSLAPVISDGHQGWASDGVTCKVGSYCNFICASGYTVNSKFSITDGFNSANPKYGKILCQASGFSKSDPLCFPMSTNLYLLNSFDSSLTFCQRVTSNGDSLLASNDIGPSSYTSLLVSQPSYGSAPSMYYLNPPGTSSGIGCQTKSSLTNHGYWSPYVLEVTKDPMGNTHLKLGWNPNYVGDYYWSKIKPNWGVMVEGNDNHHHKTSLCTIDPDRHNVNECDNSMKDSSGSVFCSASFPPDTHVTVSLFSRDNLDQKDSLIRKIFSDKNTYPTGSDVYLPGTTDNKETAQDESTKLDKNLLEDGPSEIDLKDISEKTDPNSKDVLKTHSDIPNSKSESSISSGNSKFGHVDILYVKFDGGPEELAFLDPKASYFKSDLDLNKLDDSPTGKELQSTEAQSYLHKMNEMCRYVIDKFGTYSNKICTYLSRNNDLSSSSDDTHPYNINSIGDIIQESNAFKTIKLDIQKLFIVILGIQLLQFLCNI